MKNLKEEIQSVVDIFKSGDLLKAEKMAKKLISSKTSKEVLELMHPDDIDEYLLNIKKHFKNENQSFVSEYRIPSDDGKWLWFLQRGRGIMNESGRVTKMYGLIQNFHEEKTRNEDFEYFF